MEVGVNLILSVCVCAIHQGHNRRLMSTVQPIVAAAPKCSGQQHTKPKERSTKATGNDGSRCKFNTISMYTSSSQKITTRG